MEYNRVQPDSCIWRHWIFNKDVLQSKKKK